jgi:hypothetical protein
MIQADKSSMQNRNLIPIKLQSWILFSSTKWHSAAHTPAHTWKQKRYHKFLAACFFKLEEWKQPLRKSGSKNQKRKEKRKTTIYETLLGGSKLSSHST